MPRIASQPAPRGLRWHRRFLAMLPAILTHARLSFRHLDPEAREEAVAECVANSLVAFVRLYKSGRVARAFPTALARFAVAQVKDHRKVGGHLNVKDVLSKYAQEQKHFRVDSIDHFDADEDQWQEAVVEDTRTATVPDIVAFRVDFADWLWQLPRRDRRVAQYLSLGNRTQDAARKFGVSEGRISQLRRGLAESWRQFTGESNRDRPTAE
jgi:hypothetical protein